MSLIRIISLRKALSNERARYEHDLQNQLGTDWLPNSVSLW
jgi:hypothetical protein